MTRRRSSKLRAVTDLRPIAPPERVAILDILRGCALYGVLASNVEGIFSGGWFGARLPDNVTRIGSAVLFAGFGLVLIATNL